MFRLYSPIFLLQIFCLYHAYTNQKEGKWYFIIFIFPLIGSLFYLYDNFYNQRNIENISEGIKGTFITNYKIDKLEKELKFSETVSNKILLADEHYIAGNYERAQELYSSCVDGVHQSDTELMLKLIKTNYALEDYEAVIKNAGTIKHLKEFDKSAEKIALAWSFYKTDQLDRATQTFQSMDIRFSNYEQRIEYAQFLDEIEKPDESRKILEELLDEIDSMDSYEKKLKKGLYRKIKSMHAQLA